MERFAISVPESDLQDLGERLRRTRWPGEVDGAGWSYGTDLGYLRELVEHWRARFDWRSAEASLNAFPQFRASVGDLDVHFVWQRGTGDAPLPLILSHGWPSTFYEFHKVIGPLSDPGAHGADPADAFDVVVPSLPGYGFSDPASAPGMSPRRIAAVWADLMTALGYDSFAAHGGDWGAYVTALLGHDFPDRLAGIHMTMLTMAPSLRPEPQSGDEVAARNRARRLREQETGYQSIQSTKPQTLAYGLTDSPAGLAGWIVEKWRAWSDCGGDVERRFTKDELLTTIAIYWFTRTINSSMRLYYEARNDPATFGDTQGVRVPAGFAMFGNDPGRERAAQVFDVRRYSVMPSGGHFAAMEEPELLVSEIREFFRPLRRP